MSHPLHTVPTVHRSELVDAQDVGMRIDRFVGRYFPESSRRVIARLFAAGRVAVNGRPVGKGIAVAAGDLVEFPVALPTARALPDPAITLSVLYEDAHLVVINKPAGMPSHPLLPGELGTAASGLLARYPELADVGYSAREPGLVHRLDTDTSGVLLVARDPETFARLVYSLQAGHVDKRYEALVAGHPAVPAIRRARLLARGARVKMSSGDAGTGVPVVTELLWARSMGAGSHLGLRVHRAARHQVRAHLAHLGHPLYGDLLYGGLAAADGGGHSLHASTLSLSHPHTGRQVDVEVPPPPTFQARFYQLRATEDPSPAGKP